MNICWGTLFDILWGGGIMSTPKGNGEKYSFKKYWEEISSIKRENFGPGIVLFLDVLGFKNIVCKSIDHEEEKNCILTVIEVFNSLKEEYKEKDWCGHYYMPIPKNDGYSYDKIRCENDIEVAMSLFSDSMIFTYKPAIGTRFFECYSQLHQIFHDICKIMCRFAEHGIFLRGGISFGLVHHQDNYCYGPALEEACRMEESIIYPTIGICKSFKDLLEKDMSSKELDDYCMGYKEPFELKLFAREFWSIFIDGIAIEEKDEIEYHIDWLVAGFFYDSKCAASIRNHIIWELKKKYPKRVEDKYIWLKGYYNRAIRAQYALDNYRVPNNFMDNIISQ